MAGRRLPVDAAARRAAAPRAKTLHTEENAGRFLDTRLEPFDLLDRLQYAEEETPRDGD